MKSLIIALIPLLVLVEEADAFTKNNFDLSEAEGNDYWFKGWYGTHMDEEGMLWFDYTQ